MEEAVRSGNLKRVQELIQGGAEVNACFQGMPLLSLAIQVGKMEIALELIDHRANVHAKDAKKGRTALHWACDNRDSDVKKHAALVRTKVVQQLIDGGLQNYVDEEDSSNDTPLSLTAVWCGVGPANCLLKAGANCKVLTVRQMNVLFLPACWLGDIFVTRTLLQNGCEINARNQKGETAAILAIYGGHEEILKMLILAGADVNSLDENGFTALHYAALHNHIQCGVLLAEGGANVGIKDKQSRTALDVARSEEFKEAVNGTQSFTLSKILCIIGNEGVGKSTLIAALQAEKYSSFGKALNRFKKVADHRIRTAGIESISHCSRRYGKVRFFDFAGQQDYHDPHQTILESFISNPGISMTLLLVMKLTDNEEAILKHLHDWLYPVAQMATAAKPPQVIVIGSFLDLVRSKRASAAMLVRCMEDVKKHLSNMPLKFVGSCMLNCRKPQSEGIDQLCSFLQDVPIPELKAIQTQYSLAWVWSQVRVSFLAETVQLCEFSDWMQENRENLPSTIPSPEKVCTDLSATGLALYLPNKDNSHDGWLVLDLSSILRDVYGTLFSQQKGRINKFGLLHCNKLAEYFPHLCGEMIQQLLISLEFCIALDASILKDMSNLTRSNESRGWLVFPSLVSAKPPEMNTQSQAQQRVCSLWWQLKTIHPIIAKVVHSVGIRLAAHFVVSHKNVEGVREHCCSIWKNGITWQSKTGIDVTVHIFDNRTLQVFGSSEKTADSLCQYLNDVIADIISTIRQLSPNLQAAAYIVHPPLRHSLFGDTRHPSKKPKLFPVVDIEHSIINGEEYSLSRDWKESLSSGSKELVADLFGGYTPSLQDIKRIKWMQHDPQTQSLDSSLLTPLPESYPPVLMPAAALATPQMLPAPHPVPTPTAVSPPPVPTPTAVSPPPVPTPTAASPPPVRTPNAASPHPVRTPNAASPPPVPTPTAASPPPVPRPTAASHPPVPTPTAASPPPVRTPNAASPHPVPTPTAASPHPVPIAPTAASPPPAVPTPTAASPPPAVPTSTAASPPPAVPTSTAASPPLAVPTPTVASPPPAVPTPTASSEGLEGTQFLLHVSSKPRMNDVDKLVVTPVGHFWWRLACKLGVESCVCDNINANNPKDCEGACRDMLDHWLREARYTGKEERTWSTLLKALGRADYVGLEQDLRRKYFKTV